MPSDPHSFDEIKLSFIFVPHGMLEPAELLSGHADWIKLPATLEPNSRGERQAGRPGGAGRLAGTARRDINFSINGTLFK